jgi:hypothetical protein
VFVNGNGLVKATAPHDTLPPFNLTPSTGPDPSEAPTISAPLPLPPKLHRHLGEAVKGTSPDSESVSQSVSVALPISETEL